MLLPVPPREVVLDPLPRLTPAVRVGVGVAPAGGQGGPGARVDHVGDGDFPVSVDVVLPLLRPLHLHRLLDVPALVRTPVLTSPCPSVPRSDVLTPDPSDLPPEPYPVVDSPTPPARRPAIRGVWATLTPPEDGTVSLRPCRSRTGPSDGDSHPCLSRQSPLTPTLPPLPRPPTLSTVCLVDSLTGPRRSELPCNPPRLSAFPL